MFELTSKNLGTVVAGKGIKIEFPYNNIHLITKMTVSCGCGNAYNVPKDNKIVVEYIPREVPPGRDRYMTVKAVSVIFKSSPDSPEVEQQVTFEAEVVN